MATKPIDTFANRLCEAMEKKHIRASELSRRTGINKSAISQYKSGANEPKADKLYLLAKGLGVSEAWLLGYDVSMERVINKEEKNVDSCTVSVRGKIYNIISEDGEINIDKDMIKICNLYLGLKPDHRKSLIMLAECLISSEKEFIHIDSDYLADRNDNIGHVCEIDNESIVVEQTRE